MKYLQGSLIAFLLLGCGEEPATTEKPVEGEVLTDADGDGFFSNEDCDDNSADISPSAEEICDGFDNNCNGFADEDVTSTFYVDSDGDGFGNENIDIQACSAPTGYVSTATDCNDNDPLTYPAAPEICDDRDNDCNAEIDDGLGQDFYVDLDGDGFGSEMTEEACDLRTGLSSVSGDCDDTNINISPASNEICDEIDNNCNDEVDEDVATIFYADNDTDGYGDPNNLIEACALISGYVENSNDCDDGDTLINPGSDESCDEVDNDCDGIIDEDFSIDAILFFADEDEDGFGDKDNTTRSCEVPFGYTLDDSDCDDNNANINTQSSEYCNGFDDNCNGIVDEEGSAGGDTYYVDQDGDGYGDSSNPVEACSMGELVTNSDDCDDNNNLIGTALTWFADEDGDGLGNTLNAQQSCTQPEGFVENPDDCNDQDGDVNGGMLYYRDNDGDGFGSDSLTSLACEAPIGFVDNADDCDDEDDDIFDYILWYADYDLDGFGNNDNTIQACVQPSNFIENNEDCDDSDNDIHPNADEICNGEDDNCDEVIDSDATDTNMYFRDQDGDTLGDADNSQSACEQPEGYVDNSDDCDDTNENITLPSSFFSDSDNDLFGDLEDIVIECIQPEGYVDNADDCDDNNNNISPDVNEICDDIDNNCDSIIDENTAIDANTYFRDLDEDGFGDSDNIEFGCEIIDGYVTDNTDCDDKNNLVYPNADEFCNFVDDDCDDTIDNGVRIMFYLDNDNDGFGTMDSSIEDCVLPEGYAFDSSDCDDENDEIYPGNTDTCDGIDNDCDENTGVCKDCQDIFDTLPVDQQIDGNYIIDIDESGALEPFEVYCDMTSFGGGWTRFWWHEPESTGMSGISDVLGSDLWDCSVDDDHCYALIPTETPSEMMILNNDNNSAYWVFNSSNTTSNNILNAFTLNIPTSSSNACTGAFNPVAHTGTLTDTPYHCDEINNAGNDNCDCFWYESRNGMYSFYFDDDTGWAETAFGAGYDSNDSLGVDSLETGSYTDNSQSRKLHMFYR